jgi:putative oxidoreductase
MRIAIKNRQRRTLRFLQMEEPMSDQTIATPSSVQDLVPAIARVLLSVPFIWAGSLKIVAPGTYQALFAHLGLPLPVVVWGIAIIIEIGGGLALLLGLQARVAGSVLAAWCIATALVAHTNFSNPDMQVHFMKNVAMAGGFLYVAAFGAGGRYTIQQAFGGRRVLRASR